MGDTSFPLAIRGVPDATTVNGIGAVHTVPRFHCHLDLRLPSHQVECFRGAIAEQAGLEDEWFHNHDNRRGNYHYRYPLVQYYGLGGKAALVGIGDGARSLSAWMQGYSGRLHMRGRWHVAPILESRFHALSVHTTADWHTYQLRDWLALNDRHFVEWQEAGRLADRLALLESAFVSHVMAFARGIGWYVDRRLVAEIVDYGGCRWISCRGADLLGFDVRVRVQARLPEGIGLGKGVSVGFGRVRVD